MAEHDTAILRYMQLANMTLQQYTVDLVARLCKVAGVYDERTLKDVFINGDDASIRHTLRH